MSEELQIRIHGDNSLPTLIYLPGLHGDWTLVGSFRRALGNRVRFVEFTYPRTLTWSLDDYATAVEAALSENGITHGWLLGESFSSQVVWPIVVRGTFQIEGIVLAGGFVRHPMITLVRLAQKVAGRISLSLLTRIMFGYARFARLRYRHSPETLASIREFVARRTERDRQAAVHRLQLIAQSNFNNVAEGTNVPVFAITGVLDPIVPWLFVRRWLRKHCSALREYRIFWKADHNVLGTAPNRAADQVIEWIKKTRAQSFNQRQEKLTDELDRFDSMKG
jgi:pimeloyl-ACP methyl ester carboxylesterase